VRRSLASFETNPVDVQRATDAVLAGRDHLAAAVPGAVVVTTTNFLPALRGACHAGGEHPHTGSD
jgi:pachytene checkpoint protein 2